jgi:dihydroorotase
MLGLETAASIAQEVLIDSGLSNWARFAEVMSLNPSKISGIEGQGLALAIGNPANIAVLDPSTKRQIRGGGASKSSNQPYEGMTLPGTVVHTIFRGEFTVKNSKLAK